jgi:hypothetical protein
MANAKNLPTQEELNSKLGQTTGSSVTELGATDRTSVIQGAKLASMAAELPFHGAANDLKPNW